MEEPPLVSLNTMSVRQTFGAEPANLPPAPAYAWWSARQQLNSIIERKFPWEWLSAAVRPRVYDFEIIDKIAWRHDGSGLFAAKNYRNPLRYPRLSEASLVLFGERACLAHVVGASRYGKRRSRIVASDCGSKRGANDAAHEGCRGYYRVSDRQQNTIRFWTLWSRQCRHS